MTSNEIIVTIDEGVIEGKFPKRALKHVLEWLDLHHDELLVNWHYCQQREPLKDIAPLE